MISETPTDFEKYAADFLYCEAIIKKHSKSFYAAFSQLPKYKAQSIFAIYAFCRKADDSIDIEKSAEKLMTLKAGLKALEQGIIFPDPMWRALSVVFENFSMDYLPFYQMLEGQSFDLFFKQPKTQEQLADYSYHVAGTVGLMLLPILSKTPESISDKAKKLGEAMQITNILRDVGEDFSAGRIYLPEETMTHFGVTTDMLSKRLVTEEFIALWEYEAKIAETLYEESLQMIPMIEADCQEALLSAALIYKEILAVIRKNQYQVFYKRQNVSTIRKIQLLQKAKQLTLN